MISNLELIEQYKILHKDHSDYGAGIKRLRRVMKWIEPHVKTALDFGCGKGLSVKELPRLQIDLYDPAIPKFQQLPNKQYDLVICLDVLEHLLKDNLDEIIKQIGYRATKQIIFNISCRPAVWKLPNGMNAHTIVESPSWWYKKLSDDMSDFYIKKTLYDKKGQSIYMSLMRDPQ